MMASPSPTAAYLIFGSIWDDEAENFSSEGDAPWCRKRPWELSECISVDDV